MSVEPSSTIPIVDNKLPRNIVPRIIGITGKKQHGKDTIGNYFVLNHGYQRIAFADALKYMLAIGFGFSKDQLHGHLKEESDPFWKVSPREVMQFVGTELFRENMSKLIPHVENDFWVWILKKKILSNPETKFVVTDIRFQNEMELIQELGGTTFCVSRPTSSEHLNSSLHSSETQIDTLSKKVNHLFLNDGSLEDLYEKVENYIASLQ